MMHGPINIRSAVLCSYRFLFHTPSVGSYVNALGYFNCVPCAREGFTLMH